MTGISFFSGLSVDFVIHYGVTFASHRREASEETGSSGKRVNKDVNHATHANSSGALKSSRHAFRSVFTAISMAAFTTFFVGKFMLLKSCLPCYQNTKRERFAQEGECDDTCLQIFCLTSPSHTGLGVQFSIS